VVSQSV